MKIHLPAEWLWLQLALLFMFINNRALRTPLSLGRVHRYITKCTKSTSDRMPLMRRGGTTMVIS